MKCLRLQKPFHEFVLLSGRKPVIYRCQGYNSSRLHQLAHHRTQRTLESALFREVFPSTIAVLVTLSVHMRWRIAQPQHQHCCKRSMTVWCIVVLRICSTVLPLILCCWIDTATRRNSMSCRSCLTANHNYLNSTVS